MDDENSTVTTLHRTTHQSDIEFEHIRLQNEKDDIIFPSQERNDRPLPLFDLKFISKCSRMFLIYPGFLEHYDSSGK